MTDANVVEFEQPGPGKGIAPADPPDHLTAQITVIQRWRRILSVRWLVFIALTGALAVWGYSTIDPTPWRFGVAVGYSVLVLMPTFWLYHQRSE